MMQPMQTDKIKVAEDHLERAQSGRFGGTGRLVGSLDYTDFMRWKNALDSACMH